MSVQGAPGVGQGEPVGRAQVRADAIQRARAPQGLPDRADGISGEQNYLERAWVFLESCVNFLSNILEQFCQLFQSCFGASNARVAPLDLPQENPAPIQVENAQVANPAAAEDPLEPFYPSIKTWLESENFFGSLELPYEVRTIVRVYNGNTLTPLVDDSSSPYNEAPKMENLQPAVFQRLDRLRDQKRVALNPKNMKIGIILCATKLLPNGTYAAVIIDRTFSNQDGMIAEMGGGDGGEGLSIKGVNDRIAKAIRILDNKPPL